VVEMQIKSKEPGTEETSTTNIDIGEIISKVRDFVDNMKGMGGEPMDVKVDSFDFSLAKKEGEYTVTFNTKIAIKPKD
jgi:hypothetical protein